MPVATFPLGPLDTNCHVVYNDKDALVVDPGGDMTGGLGDVLELLQHNKLKVQAIICTHCHFDHIYGVSALEHTTGATVYVPPADGDILKTEMGGGGAWGFPPVTPFNWTELKEGPHTFGSISCEVLNTPGHTPGSVSIYLPEMKSVLTGDLLFFHSVGRTDFPGGNPQTLLKSLHKKIFILPPETEVFPGHGPNTHVGEELANNPYLWL